MPAAVPPPVPRPSPRRLWSPAEQTSHCSLLRSSRRRLWTHPPAPRGLLRPPRLVRITAFFQLPGGGVAGVGAPRPAARVPAAGLPLAGWVPWGGVGGTSLGLSAPSVPREPGLAPRGAVSCGRLLCTGRAGCRGRVPLCGWHCRPKKHLDLSRMAGASGSQTGDIARKRKS